VAAHGAGGEAEQAALAQPAGHAVAHSESHGAEHHEPVVAPDQLKAPPFRRLTLLAALATVVALPLMGFIGNHEGNVEKVFMVGIAGLILFWVIADAVLRRRGLRN
jgi:hypothetical protein